MIGQPSSDWQNGTPQSMQRAPWVGQPVDIVLGVDFAEVEQAQPSHRGTGAALRGNSMNPVAFP